MQHKYTSKSQDWLELQHTAAIAATCDEHNLFLSFEESIFGGQQDIEVSCFETCDNCGGTGAKSSSCITLCTECGGRGGVLKTQKTPFGIMSQVSTCSKCGGEGKIITAHCRKCGGQGKVQSKRGIKVVIPPGVDDGATMVVRGEGNFDQKRCENRKQEFVNARHIVLLRGVSGDLYLVLHVDGKHGIWRDGLNLYSRVNIDYTEAILGTVIKVETAEGSRDLQIPSGIQPGDTVKMSKMGVPDINKPFMRGDHYFIVNVRIPTAVRIGLLKAVSEEKQWILDAQYRIHAEHTLVEKLASLRPSCKDHPLPPTGTRDSNFDKHNLNHASSNRDKDAASLWNSIKDLLRSGSALVTARLSDHYLCSSDLLLDSWICSFLLLFSSALSTIGDGACFLLPLPRLASTCGVRQGPLT
ncbi:hypothetical protein RJ640_004235 [Escallonia rubra]|uniref:CR-type domain-containing protein n=1 Tax=Escallonia rubra TaxID=112253 RepID=A0AA88RBI7_9ASTE|nr:hypothetical protein RJ640_004235 [Escallonia rubra]